MNLNRYWTAAAVLFGLTSLLGGQQPASPRDQLQQYVTQLQANPSDDALRTKIIQLAQQLQPPPATPPEADELAGRAQYIFEHANSPDDLVKAAEAFEKVALVAPWLPDYYFDAAVAYEKANHPADALRNYKLSLLAYAPDSQDAKKVREKIGALSYVLEQQQQAATAEQARRDAAAEAERQQELEAEQSRERAQQQEQQRLANLDPVVRQLDGAAFEFTQVMGTALSGEQVLATTRDTIHGGSIIEEHFCTPDHHCPSSSATYEINGKQFDMGFNDSGDFCHGGYGGTRCDWVGTVMPDWIETQLIVDGRPYFKKAFRYKRVK